MMQPVKPGHLFCFGFGFSAVRLARKLKRLGWTISGTCRSEDKAEALRTDGFTCYPFDGTAPLPDSAFSGVQYVLSSIPPSGAQDPVLFHHAEALATLPLRWIGYLSTTGVYGDTGGNWVDEATPLRPTQQRSKDRMAAECQWLDLWRLRPDQDPDAVPIQVFRLAGIYGPGRSALDQVRVGRAKRLIKPGQVFSRIHVDDIGRVIFASMRAPDPGAVYNVCDHEPAPPQDVVTYACDLLGVTPPEEVPFDAEVLSPMAASFYADNRRVRNDRLMDDLGIELRYPTYRDGLNAILAEQSKT